jgi:hypothetical protein
MRVTRPRTCELVYPLLLNWFNCLGFKEGARQLENVNLKQEINLLLKSAPPFASFLRALKRLMTFPETKLKEKRRKELQKVASSASVVPSNVVTSASGSVTPNQPTVLPDPNYSGSSTNSQDEETTKQLAQQLLFSTMFVLEDDLNKIRWQQSGKSVELALSYIFLLLTLTL